MPTHRPVMLVILDGWGWREERADNAVLQARTPTFDRLWATCPHALLHTSGNDVGLPPGQMGNSEVGHLNIGAGRVVMQDLPRIDHAIESGELAKNPVLGRFIEQLKQTGGTCHLMGLVSPGGVHSHQNHAVALAKILERAGIPVAFHAFMDGRDTPPRAGADYMARLVADLPPSVPIATVSGRYYAMDRDNRWERVSKAYDGDRRRQGRAVRRSGRRDRRRLQQGRHRRVHPAGRHRRLSRHARRRRRALLQLPRRPRARAARRDPRSEFSGFQRTRTVKIAAAAGMTQYSEAAERVPAGALPAAVAVEHPRRGRRARRPHAAAHGRDREISARHVFPQRRPRGDLSRRGPHHGPLAQGRDLRPAARNVGAGADRQGGRGDRLRQVRPDRAQLRQPRHGRPHRNPARRDQGGRNRRHGARQASPMRSQRQQARCWSPPITATAS